MALDGAIYGFRWCNLWLWVVKSMALECEGCGFGWCNLRAWMVQFMALDGAIYGFEWCNLSAFYLKRQLLTHRQHSVFPLKISRCMLYREMFCVLRNVRDIHNTVQPLRSYFVKHAYFTLIGCNITLIYCNIALIDCNITPTKHKAFQTVCTATKLQTSVHCNYNS